MTAVTIKNILPQQQDTNTLKRKQITTLPHSLQILTKHTCVNMTNNCSTTLHKISQSPLTPLTANPFDFPQHDQPTFPTQSDRTKSRSIQNGRYSRAKRRLAFEDFTDVNPQRLPVQETTNEQVEEQVRQKLLSAFNFDLETGKPVDGRYEWTRVVRPRIE